MSDLQGVAIIPARGGSKRIPYKNIRPFCGKPIIAYSIEVAIESQCFSQVLVSTDDPAIADVAQRYGATVPALRPSELSDDFTPIRQVVSHELRQMENVGHVPPYACCIFATAPFIQAVHLRESLNTLVDLDKSFVLPVGEFPYPVQRAVLVKDGKLCRFSPEHRYTRSQDLPPSYHDAGQFYWGKTQSFHSDADMISEQGAIYILPRRVVHDIDNEEDWYIAEKVFEAMYG